MKIEERREGKTVVLSIEGRLDHAGGQIFDAYVSRLIDAGERSLVVDFQGVDFLASMGLRALIKPYQALAQKGGRIAVANLSDSVRAVFRLAGIEKALPIYDSVEAAVAAS
jgi:stage II sporulation protein AA (anti-sigma F factor antagonist)